MWYDKLGNYDVGIWNNSLKLVLAAAVFFASYTDLAAGEEEKTVEIFSIDRKSTAKKREEGKMSHLSEAVLDMDFSASEIAIIMGEGAIPELTALLGHEDAAVRMTAVIAIGALNLTEAHGLLFKALKDADSNVSGTAMQKVEVQAPNIETETLLGLLEKVKEPNALKRLLLLLGTRLELTQSAFIEPYCGRENDKVVMVACAAALSKLGVTLRREQFAKYLTSISGPELNTAFDLVDYINQPWLVYYLGTMLSNKEDIQSLGDTPPGFPNVLRVCDKAVPRIANITGNVFSFPTNLHANYDDRQLKEVEDFAAQFKY